MPPSPSFHHLDSVVVGSWFPSPPWRNSGVRDPVFPEAPYLDSEARCPSVPSFRGLDLGEGVPQVVGTTGRGSGAGGELAARTRLPGWKGFGSQAGLRIVQGVAGQRSLLGFHTGLHPPSLCNVV